MQTRESCCEIHWWSAPSDHRATTWRELASSKARPLQPSPNPWRLEKERDEIASSKARSTPQFQHRTSPRLPLVVAGAKARLSGTFPVLQRVRSRHLKTNR